MGSRVVLTVLVVLTLGALGGLAVALVQYTNLADRYETLASDIKRLQQDALDSLDTPADDEVAPSAELVARIEALERRTAAQAARSPEIPLPETLDGPDGPFDPRWDAAKARQFRAALADVERLKRDVTTTQEGVADAQGRAEQAQQAVEDALKNRPDKPLGEDKKAPFSQLVAVAGLSDTQEQLLHDATFEYKTTMLEALKIPFDDGTRMIDKAFELMFLDEETPQQAKGPRLMRLLAATKIPGTDESYLQRLGQLNEQLAETYRREMTDEQWRKFQTLGVTPDNIELPDDPFGPFAQQWLANRKGQ